VCEGHGASGLQGCKVSGLQDLVAGLQGNGLTIGTIYNCSLNSAAFQYTSCFLQLTELTEFLLLAFVVEALAYSVFVVPGFRYTVWHIHSDPDRKIL